MAALGTGLRVNKRLQELNLEDNSFGPVGAAALAAGFAFNNNLTALTLSFNKLQDQGIAAVGDAMQRNCAIQKLAYVARFGASALTSRRLNSTQMTDAGATALFEGVKRNVALLELSIESNMVSDAACPVIGDALKANAALQILRFAAAGSARSQ